MVVAGVGPSVKGSIFQMAIEAVKQTVEEGRISKEEVEKTLEEMAPDLGQLEVIEKLGICGFRLGVASLEGARLRENVSHCRRRPAAVPFY